MMRTLASLLVLGAMALAQTTTAPAGGAAKPQPTSPAPATAPAAAPAQPAGTKRLPQARTQEEFDAYNAIRRMATSAEAERAADEFAKKFPESELRGPIYQGLMDAYQGNNLADKAIEMGRKSLTFDPDNPVVLILLASVIAERTREGDLDRDLRFEEAVKYSQHGLEKVDSDMVVPANTPPKLIDERRQLLKSMAHAAIGFVELNRHNDAAAVEHLRMAGQLNTVQPDAMVYLRLAIALDHLERYPEALEATKKVLSLSPTGTVADLARREKERLEKLLASAAPAPSAAPQVTPPAPANPATTPPPQNPPPADKPKQ
ncbi:MAG TPA: hypothetical protein VLA96_00310 [Terriglobales bacterium]|nr:hypothetical protein [Terriglobales bacterium]